MLIQRRSAWHMLAPTLSLVFMLSTALVDASAKEWKHTAEQKQAMAVYQAIGIVERDLSIGFADFTTATPYYSEAFDAAMRLIDGADRQGHRLPDFSQRGRAALSKLQARYERERITENAPWQAGPREVRLGSSLVPLMLPEGMRILPPEEVLQLSRKIDGPDAKPPPPHWLLSSKRGWTISLYVRETGFVANTRIDAFLLDRLVWRSNPIHAQGRDAPPGMEWWGDRMRWLAEPKFDRATARAHWAVTTGYQETRKEGRPDYVRAEWVLLGANEVAYAAYGGLGADSAELVRREFNPMWESLSFQEGHRYSDARADGDKSRWSLADFVTGPPSRAEQYMNSREAARSERLQTAGMKFFVAAMIVGPAALLLIYIGVKGAQRIRARSSQG